MAFRSHWMINVAKESNNGLDFKIPLNKGLLKPHTADALSSMESNNFGIVCHPTGTGKTSIQFFDIMRTFTKDLLEKKYPIICLSSPTLILNKQFGIDLLEFLNVIGITDFDLLIVSSDKNVKEYKTIRGPAKIETFSIVDDIKNFLINAKKRKKISLVITCYESHNRFSDALMESGLKAIRYNDEAHAINGVGDSNTVDNTVDMVSMNETSDRVYFFTATPTGEEHDDGSFSSMKDSTLYGNVISSLSLYSAIKQGLIIKPIFYNHFDKTKELYSEIDKAEICIEILNSDESLYNSLGKNPTKLLVTCSSIDEVKTMWKHLVDKSNDKYNVFITTSDKLGRIVNTETNQSFKTFFDTVSASTKPAIIIHIKQLIAGIDVSGINSVIFFNIPSPIVLLQTIGRGLRPISSDRILLEQNKAPLHKVCCPIHFIVRESEQGKLVDLYKKFYESSEVPFIEIKNFISISSNADDDLISDIDLVIQKDSRSKLHLESYRLELSSLEIDLPIESTRGDRNLN